MGSVGGPTVGAAHHAAGFDDDQPGGGAIPVVGALLEVPIHGAVSHPTQVDGRRTCAAHVTHHSDDRAETIHLPNAVVGVVAEAGGYQRAGEVGSVPTWTRPRRGRVACSPARHPRPGREIQVTPRAGARTTAGHHLAVLLGGHAHTPYRQSVQVVHRAVQGVQHPPHTGGPAPARPPPRPAHRRRRRRRVRPPAAPRWHGPSR